ncbi:MAG: zinc ribbon domain-containing protein, partial [Phenylobacterium sp.]|uniref:Zn-ribbon domain-containing OB-fold protein n=1 Tax=Phenylobacterium sp. TaxID=1871053 RepID=UPI002720F8D3
MTDVQDRPATMTRNIPAPAVTIESKPFWDAATEGKFMIKRCTACGEAHWYPRALCPFCFSEKTVWEESPGEGVIYSYSVMHRS